MSRSLTPQQNVDETAFPVRVILRGLPGEVQALLGPNRDPQVWIAESLGRANARLYGWTTSCRVEGHALYCRSLVEARLFMEAFPEFRLPNGTESAVYRCAEVSP